MEHGCNYTVTPSKAGYEFTPESKTFSTVSSNQTQDFTASEIQQYTLTMAVNTAGWGTTTPSVGSASYDEGTVVTITATPASGYRFVNWTGSVASTTSATTTVTMSADRTVTANFEEVTGGITLSIPGGTYQMGDEVGDLWDGCRPVHTVTVSSFEMSTYEVTNAQYTAYLNEALKTGDITASNSTVTGKTGSYSGEEYIDLSGSYDSSNKCWITYSNGTFTVASGKENWPVVYVTWYGSKSFALYYGLDLPTEAEWEYACRGGKQYKYGTDDGTISSSKANYNSNVGHLADVGNYPKNPFGLYDMSGNVWEWCHDWYGSYSSGSVTNPSGAQTGAARVIRGGGWSYSDGDCRSAGRDGGDPAGGDGDVGFRVVRRSYPQNY